MKNRITKLTAAAVIIIAVVFCIEMFSSSSDQPGTGPKETVVVEDATEDQSDSVVEKVAVELRPVELERELEHVDQMFASSDVGGLVNMLSEGQFESKISAANYLIKMGEGAKALSVLEKLHSEQGVDNPNNTFTPAVVEVKNQMNAVTEENPQQKLVANGSWVPDNEVNKKGRREGVRGRPRLDSDNNTAMGGGTLVEPERSEDLVVADAVSEVVMAVSTKHVIAAGFYWWSSYPADVDGDGDMDVVSAAHPDNFSRRSGRSRLRYSSLAIEIDSSSTGEGADDSDESDDWQGPVAISWWENSSGSGTTWVEHVVDPNGRASMRAFPADVDGDGDTDIIGSEVDTDAVVWWENIARGGSWIRHEVDRCGGEQLVYGADIDGDGDIDVVGATFLGGGIIWWENTDRKGGQWQKHVVDDVEGADYNRTHCLRVADMDGDGYFDIVASAGRPSGINWWQNPARGEGGWIRHYVVGSDGEVESVFPVDIDGDGDSDLIGSIRRRDGLTWWENIDRKGTEWAKHVIDSRYTSEQSVDAADMDNDGDLDIIGSAQRNNSVLWWENISGDASDWVKHVLTRSFDNTLGVYAADMDGDGDLDMLSVAHSGQAIAWFENEPGEIEIPEQVESNEQTVESKAQRVDVFSSLAKPSGAGYRGEQTSDVLEGLGFVVPKGAVEVRIEELEARGEVSVAQVPSAQNDYELVVKFNDPSGAASWYDVVVYLGSPGGWPVKEFGIQVRAYIDGDSNLVFKDNSVYWHHIEAAAPGRHEGFNFPTYINDTEWTPDWSEAGEQPIR
ncbi:MAG: FG-GAP repeat domain-containing protein [Planctomycetota bacterium]